MRKSLVQLIEIANDVKTFLGIGSFRLSIYDDGADAEFQCVQVRDVYTLVKLLHGLSLFIGTKDGFVFLRISENYVEEEQ